MRQCVSILATVIASVSIMGGCAHPLTYHVEATSCLNPVTPDTRDCADDSRPLLVRAFPLNACPASDTFKWEDFVEEETPDSVKEFLAGSPQDLVIEKDQTGEIVVRDFSRKVKCVLLVAVGRANGPLSVEVHKPSRCSRQENIKLSHYDIYMVDEREVTRGGPDS